MICLAYLSHFFILSLPSFAFWLWNLYFKIFVCCGDGDFVLQYYGLCSAQVMVLNIYILKLKIATTTKKKTSNRISRHP